MPAGCYRYQHGNRGGGNGCKLCVTLNVSTHFTSSYTGLKYRMYLITCQIYSGHSQEIRQESTDLGRHFARCGEGNLSIHMIDCVKEGEEDALRYIEGIWQNRLATFEQHGGT